jgi:hypothetical protein
VTRIEFTGVRVDHIVGFHKIIPGLHKIDWRVAFGSVGTIQTKREDVSSGSLTVLRGIS